MAAFLAGVAIWAAVKRRSIAIVLLANFLLILSAIQLVLVMGIAIRLGATSQAGLGAMAGFGGLMIISYGMILLSLSLVLYGIVRVVVYLISFTIKQKSARLKIQMFFAFITLYALFALAGFILQLTCLEKISHDNWFLDVALSIVLYLIFPSLCTILIIKKIDAKLNANLTPRTTNAQPPLTHPPDEHGQ